MFPTLTVRPELTRRPERSRGPEIRVLCPDRARLLAEEVTLGAGSSDFSASLVSLPVSHESSTDRCRRDDVEDSLVSYPSQTAVCL